MNGDLKIWDRQRALRKEMGGSGLSQECASGGAGPAGRWPPREVRAQRAGSRCLGTAASGQPSLLKALLGAKDRTGGLHNLRKRWFLDTLSMWEACRVVHRGRRKSSEMWCFSKCGIGRWFRDIKIRVLFTAEWVIQKSALVIGMQVILTIRRIWASRATAQLHASKLVFSEEIGGLSPADSKSKNARNYMQKMIRSKGSCHQHTGITGIPNWWCDSFPKHCPWGASSWLNPDLESPGAGVREWA